MRKLLIQLLIWNMSSKNGVMTEQQEEHLKGLQTTLREKFDIKYRNGQAEHGGNLWERTPLIDDLLEEALDFSAYTVTLKQQLQRVEYHLEKALEELEDKGCGCGGHLKSALSLLK